MNRLTNENYQEDLFELQKTRKVKVDKYIEIGYSQANYNDDLWNKVKAIEDIEEELGIDLITKDKVEKNRYVFVVYQNSIEINQVEIKKYSRLGIDIYDKNAVFKHNYLPYKDYGRTWALTKEELDNERN